MRGRRRGIGSYTLGDQYISPDRRMSQMLMEGSTRKGKPAHHWSDTLGRIAQQLAGGYLAGRDQKNQNVANQAFTKVEPDSYSMKPTMNDQQIMESDSVQNILRQNTDADRMKNPMIQRNINAIGYEQKAFNEGEARLNSLDPNKFMTPDMYNTEVKTLNDAMGRATQNIENYGDEFNQTMGRLNSQEPTDDQRADAVRQELLGQRKASEVNTLNEKKPQLEYAMQNLRGLENNPYAQRLLQGLMMNKMDTDAASRLAQTQRGYKDADYNRGRADQTADYTRDRADAVADLGKTLQNKVDVKNAGSGTGPFRGTGMPAQYSNILLNGDPNSPVYRAAYNEMATSKNTIDPNTGQMVSVSPDMSAFRPPTGAPINTAPQGRTPGQPSVSVTEGKGRTKPYPEFQSKSAGFYNRMMDANSEIDNLFAGKDGELGTPDDLKTGDVYNWREYASDNVPFIGNALTSDNFQRAQQAQRNWVSANLRLESGAAIPPEEMEMEFKKYFPSYGDGDAVIKQKARARKKVEQNMVTQSQGAYESMYGAGKKNPPSDAPQPPSGFKVVN
jgi:hypothetical protein